MFLVPCAPFATLPTWPRIMQMTLAEQSIRVQRKARQPGAGVFVAKMHQALGCRITWPELAETRWKPRHD